MHCSNILINKVLWEHIFSRESEQVYTQERKLNQPSCWGVTLCAIISLPDKNAWTGPISQCSYYCTPKDRDGSIKIAQIVPVVVELQRPQREECPTGIPTRSGRTNDHTIAHIRAKTVPQNMTMGQIDPAFRELRRTQKIGCQKRIPGRTQGANDHTLACGTLINHRVGLVVFMQLTYIHARRPREPVQLQPKAKPSHHYKSYIVADNLIIENDYQIRQPYVWFTGRLTQCILNV